MITLREAAKRVVWEHDEGHLGRPLQDAITALKAALVEEALQRFTDVNQELEAALGCEHCNSPLYAAVKCRVCGRVTSAEPVQEPVAWLWWGDNGDGTESKHVHIGRDFSTYWKPIRPPTPLYTAPPQRKPLTEEEIDGLMQSIGLRCADDGNERMANHAEWERRQRRRIARAIERAHGIGEKE